ncbi:hypothetical protein RQP46_002739 [Phenoliferia psychrophenolica]
MHPSYAATLDKARDAIDTLLCRWFPLYHTLTVPPVDLTGRNAIVTGANCGIGLETARKLASFGANVTLACRSAEKGEKAREDIVATTGNANVEVRLLDTASVESVRNFVTSWGEKPVDILICNAGGNPSVKYTKSSDGLEPAFQVNFLSHTLLLLLLLPRFSPHARVVNVSSVSQYDGTLDPSDLDHSLQIEKVYKLKSGDLLDVRSLILIYAHAKLAQVAFTRELQERLDASATYGGKHIIINSCHPGFVLSEIWTRNAGENKFLDRAFKQILSLVKLIGINTEQGSCTQTWLATQPELA